jgi:hypothetical protein
MAGIIGSALATSGLSAYANIRDQNGNVWNGSTFASYLLANYATYAVTLTEQVPTGYYKASFPAAIPAGLYSFIVYANATPTAGDQALDRGSIDWNGSSDNFLNPIIDKLPSGQISGFDPNASNVNLASNQSGVTIGTVNNLGASASASVKTQVDASVGSDTIAELTGVPAATPTLKTAIMFLFMALRNKRTTTATTAGINNSSGASITTAALSDDSVTFTKNNFT